MPVQGGYRDRELTRQLFAELMAISEVIEGAILIETHHFEGPLYRFAIAPNGQAAVPPASNWDDLAVDLGCKAAVHFKFGKACGFALCQTIYPEPAETEKRHADARFAEGVACRIDALRSCPQYIICGI
jgi:hypothetical protein